MARFGSMDPMKIAVIMGKALAFKGTDFRILRHYLRKWSATPKKKGSELL